jgi:nitrile hydratase subunit beta
MGGMHGMGPVVYESNEPVFHHEWEGRIFALGLGTGYWGAWTLDAYRHEIELIPPPDYLSFSYYQKWLAALGEIMVKTGVVTRAELGSGAADRGSGRKVPTLTAENMVAMVTHGAPASRDGPVAPRFRSGQRVRARNINPVGHTRLPRYARGKAGTVARDYGVFLFPDTNAHGLGEKPQHVYSVRFGAQELWGETAVAQDSVYVDLWDDYLEPA